MSISVLRAPEVPVEQSLHLLEDRLVCAQMNLQNENLYGDSVRRDRRSVSRVKSLFFKEHIEVLRMKILELRAHGRSLTNTEIQEVLDFESQFEGITMATFWISIFDEDVDDVAVLPHEIM